MKEYLLADPWKIIETQLLKENNLVSESVASLGNGRLGGRGNFEEKFNGPTLQGSYIAGIYYPDKTKVGWWKNGYPEYFAKVLNSVNWIGIDVWIDKHDFEIHTEQVSEYRAELDMKNGILRRSMVANLPDGKRIKIDTERFYSMTHPDRCHMSYSVTALNFSGDVSIHPYLDFDVRNQDSNYNESFWIQKEQYADNDWAYLRATTKKTNFEVVASMHNKALHDEKVLDKNWDTEIGEATVKEKISVFLEEGSNLTVHKQVTIVSSFHCERSNLVTEAKSQLLSSIKDGYQTAKDYQIAYWDKKWAESDIVIDGDVKAQQAIRFNIFQMHQTYTGDDHRLNIGPKGFTGEKYGGSTYWDTEAYCLPFYLSNSDSSVGRQLLSYRYKQLDKAIENAAKLGFKDGAALYPMVTMNGEECHNEWEITFEEIHRNGAIAFAIFDYIRYTGDHSYMMDGGLEVLIAISRFWEQRVNWSDAKQKFVMLGVTGPNEYENNVNNNWYTNYIARWCLRYTAEQLKKVRLENIDGYNNLLSKTSLTKKETHHWEAIQNNMYFPVDKQRNVFLQQDGFLDKELLPSTAIPRAENPIHEHWSWDRILRSCYIKQADVLQGLYLFEDDFDTETIQRNFDFYEPMTVHESSLSPCVHNILAAKIGNEDKAYQMYLRTARLDLDDYNNDTNDGLHITSMAGTWMSITKGFGGMRIKNDRLHFSPFLPEQWKSYSFKIKYRAHMLHIHVDVDGTKITNHASKEITIMLHDQSLTIPGS